MLFRSYLRNKKTILTPSTTNGYKKVTLLSKSGERGHYQVHRLVAQAFLRNPKKLEIVNHIDGDKMNNNLYNLEWTTRKGNGKHYSEVLAPKYSAQRKAKKESATTRRISILKHAHENCNEEPQLFYSLFKLCME